MKILLAGILMINCIIVSECNDDMVMSVEAAAEAEKLAEEAAEAAAAAAWEAAAAAEAEKLAEEAAEAAAAAAWEAADTEAANAEAAAAETAAAEAAATEAAAVEAAAAEAAAAEAAAAEAADAIVPAIEYVMADSGQTCTDACIGTCDDNATQALADLNDKPACQEALRLAGDPDYDLTVSVYGPPYHQEAKFTGGCGSTIDRRTETLYRWNLMATSDASCTANPSSWSGRRICACQKE